MEQVLDLALIVLLVATLFHALRLERALGVLKRDRAALEGLVASFQSSTQAAEQGIERLRGAADGTGRTLSRQMERGAGLKEDLVFLCERAERLADRLDAAVRAYRPAMPDRTHLLSPPSPPRTEPVEPSRLRGLVRHEPQDVQTETQRHRSQAERELLRALKLKG